MNLIELLERKSIRMGTKDLKQGAPHFLSVGFELEVVVYTKKNHEEYLTQVIQKITGSPIKVHSEYHETKKQSSTWYIEPDSSIESRNSDAKGLEIVTPVFPLEKGINVLRQLLNQISEDPHLGTNSTTALHVNIGNWDDLSKIDLLKLAVVTNENYVLNTFKRKGNFYAAELIPALIDNLKFKVELDNHVNRVDKDSISSLRNYDDLVKELNFEIVRNAFNDKYRAINISKIAKYGYIEFRAIGGKNYEKKVEQIVSIIKRFIRAIRIAEDPTAYREAYLKKLYVLFNDTKKLDTLPDNDVMTYDEYETLVDFLVPVFYPDGRPGLYSGIQAKNAVADIIKEYFKFFEVMYRIKNSGLTPTLQVVKILRKIYLYWKNKLENDKSNLVRHLESIKKNLTKEVSWMKLVFKD